jgi:putative chitobiose transport system substrate-binding protein
MKCPFSNVLESAWFRSLGLVGLAGCLVFFITFMLLPSSPLKKPAFPLTTNKNQIELTLWTLQLQGFSNYIKPLLLKYEALHPEQTIHWVDVPFQDAEKRTLSVMLNPKTVPDLINLNPNFSALLAQRGALLNLSPYITPTQQHAYLPVAWNTVTLNNTIFAVPWYLTSQVLVVNQKIKQCGLGNAPPPKTLDDLFPLAKQVHITCPGTFVLMPTIAKEGGFLRELLLEGVPYPSAGKPFTLHKNTLAVKRLAQWSQAYQQGYFPKESVTEGQPTALERYQAGSVLFLKAGVSVLKQLEMNAPNVFQQSKVFPQFPEQKPLLDVASMVLVVPKKSKHPKQAVELALFLTNAINQAAFASIAPVLPSNTGSYTSLHHTSSQAPQQPKNLVQEATRQSAAQLLKATHSVPLHPCQSTLNTLMDEAVQRAFLNRLSPINSLKQFDLKANQLCSS